MEITLNSCARCGVTVGGLENVVLFGVSVGISEAGEMPFMNRGTENHFVRVGDDSVRAGNVLPPGNYGYLSADGETNPHYDDQLERSSSSRPRPAARLREVAASTVDRTVLRPTAATKLGSSASRDSKKRRD